MDISQITDSLFVGSAPTTKQAEELRARDIRLIISMIGPVRPPQVFGQPPFQLLWLRAYDTWLTPIPIRRLVEGVNAALPVIQSGGRVFVHCIQGRHRSVIMAAAILITMDHTAEGAMDLLKARRSAADPQAWYVRRQIKRFERYWQKREINPGIDDQRFHELYHEAVGAVISGVARGFYAVRGKRPHAPSSG